MKIKHLLLGMSLAVASTATARDIHGVKGYYNFTGASLVNQKLVSLGTNGNKVDDYKSAFSAYGEWLQMNVGVDNTAEAVGGGWSNSTEQWRTVLCINPANSAKTDYATDIMITRNYPVVMMKLLMPVYQDKTYQNFWAEHFWDNPYITGGDRTIMTPAASTNEAGQKIPGFPGFGSNGRSGNYIENWNGKKIETDYTANKGLAAGIDSVKICNLNPTKEFVQFAEGGYVGTRTSDVKALTGSSYKDTTIVVFQLPEKVLIEGKDYAEYVILWNMYSIGDTTHVKDETGNAIPSRLLDNIDGFEIGNWNFNCQAYGYDHTLEQQPVVYIKSFRTVGPNISEAYKAIRKDNNWGDGTDSQAKQQLNYQLYYAEQDLVNYGWRIGGEDAAEEAYNAYAKAYNAANDVYASAESTDEECNAATASLQEARNAVYAATQLNGSLVYNYISSAANENMYLTLGETTTVGSLTGKAVRFGLDATKKGISFIEAGVENGQVKYTLSVDGAALVQAADGTLLAVEGATGSIFTFAGYDMEGSFALKCGDYYYGYIDGALTPTTEFPESDPDNPEAWDNIASYMFVIADALPDYNPSAEETTGLCAGWEFNSTPVDDPSTYGTIEGEMKYMSEYGETKQVDGWRMSRWRMNSRINQETFGNATCLVVTSAPTYDSWDATTTGIVNDYTTAPAFRMDSGTEEPFYVRDPNPRDESFAFHINPGVKRYFAIKLKGTGDAGFYSLNFFNSKGSTMIEEAHITGQKGDVIYFDLLKSGFAIGKQLYSSMFFSSKGFTTAGDKLAIDWMRFYDSIDAIPEETINIDDPSAIEEVAQSASATNKPTPNAYNLAGQQVNNSYKGIVILNGKKVVK